MSNNFFFALFNFLPRFFCQSVNPAPASQKKRKAAKKWMSANALAGNIFVTLTSLADEN